MNEFCGNGNQLFCGPGMSCSETDEVCKLEVLEPCYDVDADCLSGICANNGLCKVGGIVS